MYAQTYPSPHMATEKEGLAFEAFAAIAESDKRTDLTLADYQIFSGMAMLHEPCTPQVQSYLTDKCAEEFNEVLDALNGQNSTQVIEEFGDFTWTLFSLAENVAPLGAAHEIRLQLAPIIADAVMLNGFQDISCSAAKNGRYLPTVAGIAGIPLSECRPIFFGPLRKAPYIQPDAAPFGDCSPEEATRFAAVQLERLIALTAELPDASENVTEEAYCSYATLGCVATNLWLTVASRVQRACGPDSVSEAVYANVCKLAERAAAGHISKSDRTVAL